MAEAVGAGDLAVEFCAELVDGGGVGFDFGDDLVLFGMGRNSIGIAPISKGGVGGGLFLDAFEGVVEAFAVEVEDVVGTAGVAGGFGEGDSTGGGPLSKILDEPTGSLELGIDAFAGFGFWGCGGVHRVGFTMG